MPNGVPGSWALTLNEEFSANGVNTALWTPEWPGGAMSGECTAPSLVSQPGNGYMYLQVRAQSSTCSGIKNSDTGSLVESNPGDGKPGHTGYAYSYGYVEWRAYIVGWGGEPECPKGGCVPDWPALWSLPANSENEIDTMEGLHGKVCHTFWHHVSPIEELQGCQSGSYAGWHTYGVNWEPGILTFYYDGTKVGEVVNGHITATPQYLIMDDVPPGTYGGKLVAPDELTLDYVRVWQHPPPPPPEVTTSEPTELQELKATLKGTVNPEGTDTKYHFEYGPSPSYGTSIPVTPADVGSGGSPVPVSAALTGLVPGTTYYYRLTATSTAGTKSSLPATFETRQMPKPAVVEYGGTVRIFYRGPNGQMREKNWNGSVWTQKNWGYENEVASNPTAIVHPNGMVDVYYRATNGTLGQWWMYGSEWNNKTWGYANEVTGTPSAFLNPNGREEIYYRASNGTLDQWWIDGSEWSQKTWGYANEVTGSPSAFMNPNGREEIYYRASNGTLGQWWIAKNGAEWNNKTWGYANEVTESPSAFIRPDGMENVYYRASNGTLGQWWMYNNGAEWSNKSWGYANEVTGSPSAFMNPNGRKEIYYRSANGTLGQWWIAKNGAEWNNKTWGYASEVSGEPAAFMRANGSEIIFYGGKNGEIFQWWIDGSEWNLSALGPA